VKYEDENENEKRSTSAMFFSGKFLSMNCATSDIVQLRSDVVRAVESPDTNVNGRVCSPSMLFCVSNDRMNEAANVVDDDNDTRP
jgi:hypothetical protein